MKTEKGVWSYTLPPYGRIHAVAYDEGEREMRGRSIMLACIGVGDILSTDYAEGRPAYFAVDGDRIYIHPAPGNDDGELRVLFFGPLQEI